MRAFVLSVALALLAGAAQAEDQAQKLSLTVYNSDLALVEDVRQLAPPAGRSRLEFKDVSASIRPETATLSGRGLTIVEQNFDYDLLTPAKMMEKAVGKTVQIVRTNPGTGQQTTETATVLSVNDGVVLKIGDRIEVLRDDGVPTRVIFDSIPQNLRANPTLSVTVDADAAGPRETTLRYLTNGLSWQADYVAVFDDKRGLVDLQGWATLTNKSGVGFQDAATKLVAGRLNLVHGESEYFERERQPLRGQSGEGRISATSADYYVYPLPGRVTIAQNQTKQVSILDVRGVAATKVYGYEAEGFDGGGDVRHVAVALKFSNAAAPMPAGVVRVYLRDAGGDAKFIGESHIDHTPAASDLLIVTGEAFDVTVQPTVVAASSAAGDRTRHAMSYVFRNAKPEAATVEFTQTGLGLGAKVEAESQASRRIDAHTLSWSVVIPANGEATLTFTVVGGG